MCELFCMSSLAPATVNFSLEEFAKHGGQTGIHKDGWGIAFYEDNDAHLLREPLAASESPLVGFVRSHDFASRFVLSHIRRATQGDVALKNTQPFGRELGGRMHLFAHNGDLKGIQQTVLFKLGRFRPIGETDSEYAFCLLLSMMEEIWDEDVWGEDVWDEDVAPTLQQRLDIVSLFSQEMRRYGPANFLYADGEFIFVHSHKRTQPSGGIGPPGLHLLSRSCPLQESTLNISGMTISPSAHDHDGSTQQVVLVASVPLTAENWVPLQEGEILVLQNGQVHQRKLPA